MLECACGPCIGMGQSPNSHGVSLRTFNRNFEGRSGTADGQIYLVSPETAAVSALTGVLTDPRDARRGCRKLRCRSTSSSTTTWSWRLPRQTRCDEVEILRGPNIKPFPVTDRSAGEPGRESAAQGRRQHHHRPHHACGREDPAVPLQHSLPLELLLRRVRQGIPGALPSSTARASSWAAQNYGQGSSREHAALVPLYLGVKAVLVKILRAHPLRQPGERRHPAARVPRRKRITTSSIRWTSWSCRTSAAAIAERFRRDR